MVVVGAVVFVCGMVAGGRANRKPARAAVQTPQAEAVTTAYVAGATRGLPGAEEVYLPGLRVPSDLADQETWGLQHWFTLVALDRVEGEEVVAVVAKPGGRAWLVFASMRAAELPPLDALSEAGKRFTKREGPAVLEINR